MFRVAFIDHYDSFSANLIDWLRVSVGVTEVLSYKYDDPGWVPSWEKYPIPVVFGPGPNSPQDIPESADFLGKALGKVPILGICLGHQLIAHHYGWEIVRALKVQHGIAKSVTFREGSQFHRQLEAKSQVSVAFYNSLAVRCPHKDSSSTLQAIAFDNSGNIAVVEALKNSLPCVGWQFHPESFLSKNSRELAQIARAILLGNSCS